MNPKYEINLTVENEKFYGSLKIPKNAESPTKLITGSLGKNFEEAKNKLEKWVNEYKNNYDILNIEVQSTPKNVLYGMQTSLKESEIQELQNYFNKTFN